MWPNPQDTADLVTFTEEIYNGNLHFLCSPPRGHMAKMNRTQGVQKISMSSPFHFMYFQFASCVKRAASIDVAMLFLLSTLNTLSILINLAFSVLIFSPLLPADLVINNSNRIVDKLFVVSIYRRVINTSVAFSEPYQISKMDPYAKIVNGYYNPLH